MTDAPQRIWAWTTGIQRIHGKNGLWESPSSNEGLATEYIRAEAAEAEIERLREEVKQARAEALREALHVAEEMERQNGPLSKKGFNEKYRLGLQSAGNAIASAIRALIDKEAGE